MKSILKDLCLLPGLSGYEKEPGKYMRAQFAQYADEILTDPVGNLTAVFKGDPGAKKVMVFAHMDQLGFIVKKIEQGGFLRIERLGGIPEKILPGLEVIVGTNSGAYLHGVIGNKSHHITPAEEKYKVIPYQELYIDLGFTSAEAVLEAGIRIGAPVIYRPRFEELPNELCYGTAMDNRGGCAVLIRLAQIFAKKRPDAQVYLTASVQEEYNLRGACVASGYIKPDCAIALDVALTGDTPDTQGKFAVSLNGGPVISMYNFHGRGTLNGTIPHPELVRRTEEAAGRLGLNLQRIATTGLLTDASYVQLSGEKGTPVVDLGFPCRYTHTAVEVCSIRDLRALADLTADFIVHLESDANFNRTYTD